MASKVLSIEIGYSLTKVLEIDYKSKNPKVYSSFVLETPSDLFKDDVVADHPIFSEQIRTHIDAMGIKAKNAVFTIASSKIASREVPIPASVKENRIQNLIEINARDYFPIDLSDYRLSYTVLRDNVKEGLDEKKYILVLAAPKALLESYVRFGRTCGLETVALDYNGNSLYEAVKESLVTEETKMIVKLDEKNTFCMIVKGKDIVFTRNITYGIDDAIETIIANKNFEGINTYLDAIDLVRSKTCIYSTYKNDEKGSNQEASGDSQAMYEAKCEVTGSLRYLTGGIARVIDFFKSKNPDDDIKNIYVTGIGADFSGLQKLIGSDTGVECKVFTNFNNIHFDKSTKELPLGEYITCIGAAINSVNFVVDEDNDLKSKKASTSFSATAFLMFGLCVIVSLALFIFAYLPYKEEQATKKKLETKIQTYSQAYDVYVNYVTEKTAVDKLKYYGSITDSNNNHIVEFINEMEEKMPKSLRVQSLAATNDGITMSVTVDSKESTAKLIEQFGTFENVKKVTVNSVSITTNEIGEQICSFSVSITLGANAEEDEATE